MKRNFRFIILILLIIGLSFSVAQANPFIDLEGGLVYTDYNDIRIPGDGGTKFSLADDLDTSSSIFIRLRIGLTFLERHTVSFLYAPLTLKADGYPTRSILFNGDTFAAGSYIQGTYRFDSYRLTYRYDFILLDDIVLGAGLTAKIRDASVELKNSSLSSEKKNTGFVPLINLRLQWNVYDPLSLIADIDALWAPQGRAEDILIALQLRLNRNLALRAGYRMLEGGADSDEVYTITLLHYAVFGFTFTF